MSSSFEPNDELVIVKATAYCPTGVAFLKLALDPGATGSMINTAMMVAIGLDPALSQERREVVTGSGIEFAPKVFIPEFHSLGIKVKNYPVLCHTLPQGAMVDGVLGLDFFRNKKLVIDFQKGLISVEPPETL